MHIGRYACTHICIFVFNVDGPLYHSTWVEVGGKLNESWFSNVWILGREPRSLCLAEGGPYLFSYLADPSACLQNPGSKQEVWVNLQVA